jgi:hypothetical protein
VLPESRPHERHYNTSVKGKLAAVGEESVTTQRLRLIN